MLLLSILSSRWLGVPYTPRPEERAFLERAQTQAQDGLEVSAAVLDGRESERFFGVPLARHGLQPVWLRLKNQGDATWRLRLASLDPNYYPPLEAAFVCHFRLIRRLLEFGVLAWIFFPLLCLLPLKLLAARAANRRMDAFFTEQGIGWGPLRPNSVSEGFVFATLDEGSKQFTVRVMSRAGTKNFAFAIPIPGLKVDHHGKELEAPADAADCTAAELRERLAELPRCTANASGSREGDPLNLVAIGGFDAILSGFGAGWDETETISFASCVRTAKAFLVGSRYRYSPISPLYVFGRSQDFALQRSRQTINERLHLRLWLTHLRFQGQPVWLGQVSRDIGVRFTWRTWNLTTHKIDPDVDDARDYVLDTLMESGKAALVGYAEGAQAAPRSAPRRNLTGDPYFTDGFRAVAAFSETRTETRFLEWT